MISRRDTPPSMNSGSRFVVWLWRSGRRLGQVRIITLPIDMFSERLSTSWQVSCFSSAVPGSQTPVGSFSSRLRHLLSQSTEEDTAEVEQARKSFLEAVGLSCPEAKEGIPPEVRNVVDLWCDYKHAHLINSTSTSDRYR